jgi:hypothetical protein
MSGIMDTITGKKTSTVKVEAPVAQPSVASDLDLMKSLLQAHGISIEAEKERREEEALIAAKRAARHEKITSERKIKRQLDQESAAELVKQQHIFITMNGERVEDWLCPCPICRDSLLKPRDIVTYLAGAWRLARNKLDLNSMSFTSCHSGRGSPPFYLEVVKCGHCGEMITAMVQLVH